MVLRPPAVIPPGVLLIFSVIVYISCWQQLFAGDAVGLRKPCIKSLKSVRVPPIFAVALRLWATLQSAEGLSQRLLIYLKISYCLKNSLNSEILTLSSFRYLNLCIKVYSDFYRCLLFCLITPGFLMIAFMQPSKVLILQLSNISLRFFALSVRISRSRGYLQHISMNCSALI